MTASRPIRAHLALLTVVGCAIVAAPAGAAPVVAPGYPVVAPAVDAIDVAPDGRTLMVGPAPIEVGQRDAAAVTAGGRPLWRTRLGPWCGNCWGGVMSPSITPDGLFQPIGYAASGISAVDARGRETDPTCAGALANDGRCYTVAEGDALGIAPLRSTMEIVQSNGWRTTDPRLPAIDPTEDLIQPVVAVVDGAVVIRPTRTLVAALDAEGGHLLWTREVDGNTIGPQVAANAVAMGDQDGVEWVTPATGQTVRRVSLERPTRALVADARRGTVAVAFGPRMSSSGPVWRITPDGAVARLGSRATLGEPVAISPNGAILAHRPGVALTRLSASGRVIWRLPTPAGSGWGVSRPAPVAHQANGDIMVAAEGLLYRVRSRPGRTAVRQPRLTVTPARARMAGPHMRCTDLAGHRCTPSAPRGVVARLDLPTRLRGSAVTVTVHRASTPSRAIPGWRFTLSPRTSRLWFALDDPRTEACRDCPRPTLAAGRHLVQVRWTAHGRTHTVRAPLTVLRPDAR